MHRKRIFLDTSFLMPLFALETSIDISDEELVRFLSREDLEFQYQMISIIEIKWLIKKAGKNNGSLRGKLEIAFSDALRFIENNPNIISFPFDSDVINDISYELELLGHQDYFDSLILASAILESDILLSEDNQFTKLIEKQKQVQSGFYNDKFKILTWTEFKKLKM